MFTRGDFLMLREAAGLFLALALAACGTAPEPGNKSAEAVEANAAGNTASAADDPDRMDPVLGLFGTEAQLGAVRPDCAAFPPATGPRSVLGVTPGMTLPQASSTLRCQFPNMRSYDDREVWFHSFTGIRHGPNARRGFGVEIPGEGSRPSQQINVYLAGGMNRERVFAIRTGYYDPANPVPIETVTAAVAGKYGPLDVRYLGDGSHAPGNPGGPPVFSGLGQPADIFCMGLISLDFMYPDSGSYNEMNIPWERAGACGTRLYYKPMRREGLAEGMMLLLIDFSLLPGLHAQEVADAERAWQERRNAEMERARSNAEQGRAPRL